MAVFSVQLTIGRENEGQKDKDYLGRGQAMEWDHGRVIEVGDG